MATPKLLEAACKGTHSSQGGPDDDGSEESIDFYYLGSENADSVTGAGGGGGDFGHADILFGAAADNPPLSEDRGIAWVSGDGGTRDHGNNDVVLTGFDGLYGDHGSSILEFSVENFPNNSSDTPDTLGADVGGQFYARESALESRGYTAGHFALEIEGQFASHLSLYDLIV